jgi:hypothetical protein
MSSEKINVFFIGPESVAKGLHWAFQSIQKNNSWHLQFTQTSLKELSSGQNFQIDILLMTLDLGQPVPTEILSKISCRSALIAILQPTAQQLLSVGDISNFHSMAWDGLNFEKLAQKLTTLVDQIQKTSLSNAFSESFSNWIRNRKVRPGYLELTESPSEWKGSVLFPFDYRRKSLSLGALNSNSDIKIGESGTDEFLEFRFQNNTWTLHIRNAETHVKYSGQADDVKVGDHLELRGFSFQISPEFSVKEVSEIALRSGLSLSEVKSLDHGKTLSDVCKYFLGSWVTGELRISAGLRHGSIFFSSGHIEYVVAGAVSGAKALGRVLGWPNPTWKFIENKRTEFQLDKIDFEISKFSRFHKQWKEQWQQYSPLTPPAHMQLRVSAKVFDLKKQWTPREYQVVSAVSEYCGVREIFNNCSLDDMDILKELVEMRKLGLIEPVSVKG